MRCILIEDAESDKSAVSLDVNVGCSLDEEPFLGTAHLLEHMLFLGTKKYP
jgi:insulysin